MKTLAFVLCMLLFPSQPADYYYVIKVKGTIINKNTGKILAPGDQVKPTDQLSFSSAADQAVVLSGSKGKFTLGIPQDNLFEQGNLMAYADKSLSPIESRGQLATRSLSQSKLNDLKNYLGNNTFYIIGSQMKMMLDENKYPLSPEAYIELEIAEKNNQALRLKNENQFVLLSLNDFNNRIQQGKNDTISGVSFYHYDNTRKVINKITDVNLIFLDESALTQEMKTIINVLKQGNMDSKEINAYIFQYFLDIYGQTDTYLLNQYISGLNP